MMRIMVPSFFYAVAIVSAFSSSGAYPAADFALAKRASGSGHHHHESAEEAAIQHARLAEHLRQHGSERLQSMSFKTTKPPPESGSASHRKVNRNVPEASRQKYLQNLEKAHEKNRQLRSAAQHIGHPQPPHPSPSQHHYQPHTQQQLDVSDYGLHDMHLAPQLSVEDYQLDDMYLASNSPKH